MLSFRREKNIVVIKIEHGIWGDGDYFTLEINQSFDYQSELLCNQLQDNMNNKLKKIKQDAYNQGWKDAKGKKNPKRTSFWGGWIF